MPLPKFRYPEARIADFLGVSTAWVNQVSRKQKIGRVSYPMIISLATKSNLNVNEISGMSGLNFINRVCAMMMKITAADSEVDYVAKLGALKHRHRFMKQTLRFADSGCNKKLFAEIREVEVEIEKVEAKIAENLPTAV